ncbi:MAG: Bug family tripartite tricarboxylate transporter substrate binding protein [Burkholderiaceae bacterium]
MATPFLPRRRWLALASGMAASSIAAFPVFGQTAAFPSRPLRIIVPFAAGSGSDVFARVVGQELSEIAGQPVVIDNRVGGGGIVGTSAAAQAPADGYHLMMVANPFTILAGITRKPPYDPLVDFAPIAKFAMVPMVLSAGPKIRFDTIDQLIAYAKAHPGKLSYASSGPGTSSQILMELFKQAASVDIVEVPYKDTSKAMLDVIGGQVDLNVAPMPMILQHAKSGAVQPLGLFYGKRSALLPEVPHIGEVLKFSAAPLWYGFVTSANVPPDIRARLSDMIVKATQSPKVAERFAAMGAEPVVTTNEQFVADMKAEVADSGRIARVLGILR